MFELLASLRTIMLIMAFVMVLATIPALLRINGHQYDWREFGKWTAVLLVGTAFLFLSVALIQTLRPPEISQEAVEFLRLLNTIWIIVILIGAGGVSYVAYVSGRG